MHKNYFHYHELYLKIREGCIINKNYINYIVKNIVLLQY